MDEKIMPEISVIICTHNPRLDYLERVLVGLRGQSFPLARWELLLIDNKSEESLTERVVLSWHPQGRVVREEQIGLTQARLRGIAEARGELLVFVDDDNVLRADYLEQALKNSVEWPKLGAWSGSVVPEFEIPPPKELKPYLWMLCIRPIEKDSWGNEGSFDSTPWGAGMCVRKCVAQKYASNLLKDPEKSLLDRRGENLASSGDIDMARTSFSLKLGTGVFSNLTLTHFIPKNRLALIYILKLLEDSTAANYVFFYSKNQPDEAVSTIDKIVEQYKYLRASRFEKQIAQARERGIEAGKKFLKKTFKDS